VYFLSHLPVEFPLRFKIPRRCFHVDRTSSGFFLSFRHRISVFQLYLFFNIRFPAYVFPFPTLPAKIVVVLSKIIFSPAAAYSSWGSVDLGPLFFPPHTPAQLLPSGRDSRTSFPPKLFFPGFDFLLAILGLFENFLSNLFLPLFLDDFFPSLLVGELYF